MASPARGRSITTPYGIPGAHWKACGKHTGVDYAAPAGFRLVAAIAGQIRHREYGAAFGKHQFAISPDADQPFGPDEVFYAHTRTRLPDGTRVEIGDFVAEVGDEGNTTGPHLHFEYHKGKNSWNCDVIKDPAPVIAYGENGGGGVATTDDIYSDKLGYGEPTNGDAFSDTVKELQHVLNDTSLPAPGNVTLPITGKYDDATDAVVRVWQKEICGDTPDPAKRSYLGPNQREVMFPAPPYTIHDTGLPAIAKVPVQPPPGTADGTTLGRYLKSLGFTVHDTEVPLGRESKWLGVEYIMIHHTASPAANRAAADAAWIRTGGDAAPLAQLMLDRLNEVWVCCRERDGQPSPGRASHAGSGSGYGIPDGTMNERSLGIEVCNDGTQPLSSDVDQYQTLIRLTNACREFYKVTDIQKVIGHKEWSSTGKIDPLDNMAKIRADIAAGRPLPPVTEPPPPTGWDYITQVEADARYAAKKHDHGPPPVAVGGGNRTTIWTDYSGKPTKAQVIQADGVWRMLDGIACDDPPVSGSEHHMLYARVNFRWRPGSTDMAKVEVKYVREGGDSTAYDERHYANGTQSVPFQQLHFEDGQAGVGGRWWMKFHGGLASVEITTRYAKTHVIAVTG